MYQLIEITSDNIPSMTNSGNIGVKGSYPRQILIEDVNFIFYTNMDGYLEFIQATQSANTVSFSDSQFILNSGEKIKGDRIAISEAKGYWVISFNQNG